MALPPLVEPGAPLTIAQKQRFSRHLLLGQLGEAGQRRLLNARVGVVGAGGLGSPILLYLAAAGVGHLGIVDDDVVEESNLQRQILHTTADVGRAKIDSAAQRVRELNPDVVVTRHRERLTRNNAAEVLGGYDLVLDGTDNFPTRYLVDDTCAELGLPLVWGSILRFDAQVSVFWAGRGPTLRDLFPAPPAPGTTPSCGEAGVLGAMCGQVGSLMAAEAVKLLAGIGEPLLGRVAVLDVLAARWHEIPLRARTTSIVRPTGPGAPNVTGAVVPAITAQELAARLKARDQGTDAFILLDVREGAERDIAVIPGAEHVRLAEVLADPRGIATRLTGAPPDGVSRAEVDVVVHCRSGGRSHQAAQALAQTGLRAINLDGGVLAWARDVDPALPTY